MDRSLYQLTAGTYIRDNRCASDNSHLCIVHYFMIMDISLCIIPYIIDIPADTQNQVIHPDHGIKTKLKVAIVNCKIVTEGAGSLPDGSPGSLVW